jgi:hypothetical protein
LEEKLKNKEIIISIFALFILLVVSCSKENGQNGQNHTDAWKTVESNTEKTLWSIWGTKENNIWAVGDEGTIIHYDGTRWVNQKYDTECSLRDIQGYDENDVWAVGGLGFNPNSENEQKGIILHFNGKEWTMALDDSTHPLSAIWETSKDDIYAVGGTDAPGSSPGPYILHYDGTTWTPIESPEGLDSCRDIWGSVRDTFWVTTGDKILHYDKGKWEYIAEGLISDFAVNKIWGKSENNVYFSHCLGLISNWNGSTITDALRLSPSFEENNLMNFYGIWGDEQSERFAVGGYWKLTNGQGGLDGAMVYYFDGFDWTEHDVRNLSDTLYDVWGTSINNVWAVGVDGNILRFNSE